MDIDDIGKLQEDLRRVQWECESGNIKGISRILPALDGALYQWRKEKELDGTLYQWWKRKEGEVSRSKKKSEGKTKQKGQTKQIVVVSRKVLLEGNRRGREILRVWALKAEDLPAAYKWGGPWVAFYAGDNIDYSTDAQNRLDVHKEDGGYYWCRVGDRFVEEVYARMMATIRAAGHRLHDIRKKERRAKLEGFDFVFDPGVSHEGAIAGLTATVGNLAKATDGAVYKMSTEEKSEADMLEEFQWTGVEAVKI